MTEPRRSRAKRTGLPEPECPHGYTSTQVEEIMGDGLHHFYRWMAGQTVMICDGRRWDYDLQSYMPTGCEPGGHGAIFYRSDVERYLDGGRPLD